ncbi:branched-chain amino acid aminotransferase [Metabacillus bambusae]|uniref:branched-chain amino acid aminotransferase n=1 Tax=Metabacillus bambusae TaxID=2795218 RepID=UPI001FB14D7A|nr:branched-chain amino acid aminotransferase [Metabacillus bambusae]
MLKNQMKQFIITIIEKQQALKQTKTEIAIYKEEIDYIEKHDLLSDELKGTLTFVESNPITRFEEAYIERGHKETEEVIANETFSFLDHSVKYLKEHMEEFIYLESKWLELIGVDAISLEVDDVFSTYDVMLGLKLQKKHEKVIREYLSEELNGKAESFDLMFNQNDGMWDLNFTLDYISEFNQDITLGEAYCLIYQVLFKLVETVEEVNDKQM